MVQEHFAFVAASSLSILCALFLWIHISQIREQHHREDDLRVRLAEENQKLQTALEHAHDDVESKAAQTAQAAVLADISRPDDQHNGFAYAFYATSDSYACGALVNIERLQHLQTRYPVHILASSGVSQKYLDAFTSTGAVIHIEEAPPLSGGPSGYYGDCLLKLLAFKLHRLSPGLKRVLAFDSDQLIMQNLDHLFTGLPAVDLASPRAYWLAKHFLASTFMLIDLSDRLWEAVNSAVSSAGYNEFDMDIINKLLGDEVMMLSGEYVTLNSHWEDWNLPKWYHPEQELNLTTIARVNAMARGGMQTYEVSNSQDRSKQSPKVGINSTGLHSPGLSVSVSDIKQSPKLASKSPGLRSRQPQQMMPRFPDDHPLSQELHRLQDFAAVIHFSALGKPWTVSEESLLQQRPDAHPLLGEQFRIWRASAAESCPGFKDSHMSALDTD